MSKLDGTISQKEGLKLPEINNENKLTSFGEKFRQLRAQEKLKHKQALGNTTQQTLSKANARSTSTMQKPPLRQRRKRQK